ncbi:MAG: tryptophan 7-halogenase [Acidobacteriota bacterium]|nr:tryptophan 7-halogenase [Acidobacteriota bacterium]
MTASQKASQYDGIIVGGGPAGALAARQLALAGLRPLVLEKHRHPRFHIGESLLPRTLQQLRELGLEERLQQIPHVPKLGGEFLIGHAEDPPVRIWFRDALGRSCGESVNLARAPFDEMLLEAAREAGAEVREDCAVRSILRLEDGDVAVDTEEGEFRGQYLIDASGQATVVGRHLGTRQVLPRLKKVAYYGHFRGVRRQPGPEGGFISIIMCEEGWFWIIPLDDETTSIGLVLHHGDARKLPVPAHQVLGWAVRRCPALWQRCEQASFPERNHVTADFSYTCRPFAGPGYFLTGDAATFVDPVFSTGVCMGMMSAQRAAEHVTALVQRRGAGAESRRRSYRRYIERSSKPFFRLVDQFYEPAFRELLLNEEGPFQVHRALISLLAGNVFPRPIRSVRWRLHLFNLFVALQRRVPLTPRHRPFALFSAGDESSPQPPLQHSSVLT